MSVAPGFLHAGSDAQRSFRAILTAMSRPGTLVEIAAPEPPAPLSQAAAAVLLTLCDAETPVWLDRHTAAVGEWLRFHCGAPVTREPLAARFALVGDPALLPPLDSFALGTDDYPDRSATLIIEALLENGPLLRLTGPGIEREARLAIGAIGASFWQERAELAPFFPRGLDLIITSGSRLAALPRGLRVEL